MAENLTALLQRLLQQHYGGKKGRMAEAIGMTASPLGRLIEGKVNYFSTEACLRLAEDTGEPASGVLRAAGKADVADLIERLYGEQTTSAADRLLLAEWHQLPESERATMRALLRKLPKADKRKRSA